MIETSRKGLFAMESLAQSAANVLWLCVIRRVDNHLYDVVGASLYDSCDALFDDYASRECSDSVLRYTRELVYGID